MDPTLQKRPRELRQRLSFFFTIFSTSKIFKETCRIDWNQPVKKIYDFIRGLSPYPAAWSELIASEKESVVVKIFEVELV